MILRDQFDLYQADCEQGESSYHLLVAEGQQDFEQQLAPDDYLPDAVQSCSAVLCEVLEQALSSFSHFMVEVRYKAFVVAALHEIICRQDDGVC